MSHLPNRTLDRRQLITGAAALTTLMTNPLATQAQTAPDKATTFLELKTYRLHNSDEAQAARVSTYLETGLFPALTRAGALSGGSVKPVAALANLIGADGPYLVSIVQYASLAAYQDTLAKLTADSAYIAAADKLSTGTGMPFVTIESTVLHSLAVMPQPEFLAADPAHPTHVFELRTYQSQSPSAVIKKAGMFNGGEIGVFQRSQAILSQDICQRYIVFDHCHLRELAIDHRHRPDHSDHRQQRRHDGEQRQFPTD